MLRFTSVAAAGAALLALPLVAACTNTDRSMQRASAPAPLVEALAAVTVPVSDIEAAEAFYVAALDATYVRRMDVEAYREAIYALPNADGAKLVLIQVLGEGSTLGPVRMVFNTTRAEDAVAASVAAGAVVEREAKPVPGMDLVIGIVHDADGNTLEFIQR